jgi:hypothetical protein
MNRRSFLLTLAGTAAATTFDPEMFGWVKRKTIFIPEPQLFYPKFYSVDIHLCQDNQLEFWKAQTTLFKAMPFSRLSI